MPPLHLMPHSCGYCRSIVIDCVWSRRPSDPRYPLWDKLRSLELADKISGVSSPGTYPFKFTFGQARNAAINGCAFAQALLLHLLRPESLHFMPQNTLAWRKHGMDSWELVGILNRSLDCFPHRKRFPVENLARQVPDISSIEFEFQVLLPHPSLSNEFTVERKYTQVKLDVFTPTSNPASKKISSRPMETDPSSEEALGKSVGWLHNCLSRHAICKTATPQGKWTPTRLLDVWGYSEQNPTGHIRLVEPRSVEDTMKHGISYAALSYVWGGDQPLKLDSSTISDLRAGIQLSNLPATIRDAVYVCVRLKLKYLWIDALCIKQDDDKDKAEEIAAMPNIYRHAVVTISATRSPSVHHGFLGRRAFEEDDDGLCRAVSNLGINPSSLAEAYEVQFVDWNPAVYGNLRESLGSVTLCSPDQKQEPLLTRGWTFQEQLLSTRTIEFGSIRTIWHCLESHGVPGLTDGWKDSAQELDTEYSWHDRHRKLWQLENSTLPPTVRPNEINANALSIWKGVVESYSKRRLTVSTDRILAISGIASKLSPHLGSYLAGLWRESFIPEMLWIVDADDDVDVEPRLCSRPNVYQGPSWSWLSISSPVTYFELSKADEDEEDDVCYSEEEFEPFLPPMNRQMILYRMARVEDCTLQPTYPEAHFGSIIEKSALLKISGRVREATMKRRKFRPSMTHIGNQIVLEPDVFAGAFVQAIDIDSQRLDMFPDTLDDCVSNDQEVPVLLLELFTRFVYREKPIESLTHRDSNLECVGLTLAPVEGETNRFRRTGLFRQYVPGRSMDFWGDDWETVDYSSKGGFERRVKSMFEDCSLFKDSECSVVNIS